MGDQFTPKQGPRCLIISIISQGCKDSNGLGIRLSTWYVEDLVNNGMKTTYQLVSRIQPSTVSSSISF